MRFEELEVWKRAARLSATLYQETAGIKDWEFRDQVTRSGLSIPSNIAEGHERDSSAEIARFLTIPKGSAGELVTQLYIGREAGYVDAQNSNDWVGEAKEIAKMLGALIRHWRNHPKKSLSISSQ